MKYLIALILFLPAGAHASGNRVGNGGHVVACPNGIEILDFYESNLKLKDFSEEDSYQDIIGSIIKNLARFSPSQAKQYERRFSNIEKEFELKSNIRLVIVLDANYLFVPKDKRCKVQQIAIRRFFKTEKRQQFIVDLEKWNLLSARSKAGLIMHEIIYEHFFKLGQENSDKVRLINAYLFSQDAHQDQKASYWKIITDLKLPIYQ